MERSRSNKHKLCGHAYISIAMIDYNLKSVVPISEYCVQTNEMNGVLG